MKQCPQCNRTYPDDTLAFCLADGALLSAPYSAEETLFLPATRTASSMPTEVVNYQPQSSKEVRRSNSKIIYAIIAVMSVVIVALASVIIIPRLSQEQKNDKDETGQTAKTANEPAKTVSPSPDPANIKTQESSPPTTSTTNTTQSSLASSSTSELATRWEGQWSSPFGTIFLATLQLEATGTGNGVKGHINWTMKSTPQAAKQSKIGLKAVEYVRGSYNPETRMLTMEGYREDDPNDIITPDKYRLVLAEDNRSLGGATWNHGRWRGRLSLTR